MIRPQLAGRSGFFRDKLLLLILVLLLVNTSLVAFGYLFVIGRFTDNDSVLFYKQELARDLSDYNHRLARELEVYDLPSVRDVLAEYNHAVELASSSDELIQVMTNQGRKVQEKIHEEAASRLKERVLIAVKNDIRVQQTTDKTHLMIRTVDGTLTISPDRLLNEGTVRHINQIFSPGRYHGNQSIDIEIENGKAQLVVPLTFEDQIRALSEDLNSLRISLQDLRVQAGLAEMVGPGIILQVFDAEEGRGSESLVHDADIRDLVNELLSSGARGVSVGNQRLTATSAIRCSGPLIMVNHVQVPTNPVLIQAVGEPRLLTSGLDIIRNEMERTRGLVFDISASGFIKLPAYTHNE